MDDVVEAKAAPAIQLRRDIAEFCTVVDGKTRAITTVFISQRNRKDVKINILPVIVFGREFAIVPKKDG